MKEIHLFQLNKNIKLFLVIFLIVLTSGVSLGLAFLFHTTSFSSSIVVQRVSDSNNEIEEDFGINESNSKSIGELLMTTHNHILGFSFIFFFVGAIFYFNSIINGFWKMFLIIEPLISTVLSFGSLLALRLICEDFIYLTIISAIVMYLSFYIMVIISIYELTLKQYS